MIWWVIGGAIVVAGIILLLLSRRRAADGVASFQRQIDALSPEARRPVVDQVQQLEEESRADDANPDGDGGDGS